MRGRKKGMLRKQRQNWNYAVWQRNKVLQLKLQLQEDVGNTDGVTGSVPTDRGDSRDRFCSNKLIPPFNEKRDDLDVYIQRFEWAAAGQGWPLEKWAFALSLCLTGEALTVVGRMSAGDSLEYPKMKLAFLQRFR